MPRRPLRATDPGIPRAETLRLEDLEVTLVGAGRSGSHIALTLAMLGISLRLYDGDRLGPENLGLQLYCSRDVQAERRKVTALRRMLHGFVPGCRVRAHPVWFEAGPEQACSPIVIFAVDTMKTRRTLWERLRRQSRVVLLLDVRLGRGLVRLHEVRITDDAEGRFYDASLHDDAAALQDDCDDAAATPAAAAAAALVGGALRGFAEGLPRPRWIGLDLERALWAAGPCNVRQDGAPLGE